MDGRYYDGARVCSSSDNQTEFLTYLCCLLLCLFILHYRMPFTQRWPDGTKVSKSFDGEYFDGVVKSFDTEEGYYFIEFEDGDKEDFDEGDMEKWIVHPNSKRRTKPKTLPIPDVVSSSASSDDDGSPSMVISPDSGVDADAVAVSGRSRRCRKVVSYKEEEDDEVFDDSSVEKPPKKRSRKGSTSGRRQPKEADDDEFSFDSVDESEDEDKEGYEDDDDYAEVSKVRRRSKGTGKAKATRGVKGGTKAKGTGKSMAESFKPMDTPVYWDKSLEEIRKKHEYYDPW